MTKKNQLQQLITILGEDFDLTGEDIADMLWLIKQRSDLELDTFLPEIASAEPEKKLLWTKSQQFSDNLRKDRDEDYPSASYSQQDSVTSASSPHIPITSNPETPSESVSQSKQPKVLPIQVPDAPSLREPLQLAQAFRPLIKKIESGQKIILDEAATVQKIAENQIYLPVLKPETELWLDLALVIDESPSMSIWQHTIQDFQRLVKNYGIFRDVRVWGLMIDHKGEVKLRPRLKVSKTHPRLASPRELLDPNGRCLILIVSDCVSQFWYDGAIISPLSAWSQGQPLAILQMLPEWMWLRTGLGLGASVLFKSLASGVVNQKLQIEELLLRQNFELEEGIKLPILTLDSDLSLRWSEMISGKSDINVAGFVFPPSLSLDKYSLPESEVTQLTSEGRITRFRQTSSPIARKLAGLLAAAPMINLPVVRLIQETLLPQSNQIHVAEVFLGGLLKPLNKIEPGMNPDQVQYGFMDNKIRDIFLEDAPIDDSAEVFDQVSQYVAARLNKTLREFVAFLKAPTDAEAEGMVAFAEISVNILKGLGGAYRQFAEEIEQEQQKIQLSSTQSLSALNLDEIAQEFQVNLSSLPIQIGIITVEEPSNEQDIVETLQTVEFTTPRVDRRGTIIETKTYTAQYFTENVAANSHLKIMVIPEGEFWMGSRKNEGIGREKPQHWVKVPSFYMSQTPITQAQWRVIAQREDLKVGRDLETEPSRFKGDNRPVESVNWYDAIEYCARLSKLTGRNYRLPSEAEWEYACRCASIQNEVENAPLPEGEFKEASSSQMVGAQGLRPPQGLRPQESQNMRSENPELTLEDWNKNYYQPFHFGETLTSDLAHYDAIKTFVNEPYREETTPVGTFPPNAFGLYDMHGNVYEWCLDPWHDNYKNAPNDGSVWDEDNNDNYYQNINYNINVLLSSEHDRVIRGGCWFFNLVNCRSAYRDLIDARSVNLYQSLRVVCGGSP